MFGLSQATVNEGCAKEYGWSLNNVITGAPFKISERPDVVLPEPYHSTIVNDSDHAQRQNYSTSYTEMDGYRAEVNTVSSLKKHISCELACKCGQILL
eukprot:scaffold146927_cov18-Tisochrysis_lutea.AAC.2